MTHFSEIGGRFIPVTFFTRETFNHFAPTRFIRNGQKYKGLIFKGGSIDDENAHIQVQCVREDGVEEVREDLDMVPFGKAKKPVDENVNKIFDELCKLIPVELPGDKMRVMYQGMPQSGKSELQFILLWYSCFVLKKGTIHLLMERIDSLLQNLTRDYPSMCSTIQNICLQLGINDYENYIFDYRPFPKYALKKIQKKNTKHVVYVAIANVSQLKKIKSLSLEKRSTLVIDEADVFVKNDGPVMKLIEEISGDSVCKFECTASPFSNFNKPGQVYDKVALIPPKPIYRGYSQIVKHLLPVIFNLNDVLEDIFKRDTGDFKNITLVNVDSKNDKQFDIAKTINERFHDQAIVHVQNSNKKSTFQRPVSEMMNTIANLDDKRPVVIISGLMASRAVTYRTSKSNPKQAIITSMIYAPSDSANQTTLMQAMRIFGNYGDEYPEIHAYWEPDVDIAIRDSFKNILAITSSVEPGKESRKCIEQVPVSDVGRKFSMTDDSKFDTLDKIEFKTRQKLNNFLTNNFNRYKFEHAIVVTKEVKVIETVDFSYGGEDRDVRELVKSELIRRYSVEDPKIHVAWSEDRYQQLFNVKNRKANPHYKMVHFTCGNPEKTGVQTSMPCVVWKEGYEDVSSWNDPDTVYIFQTTKKKWKVWLPRQMEAFKKIKHE